MSGFEGPIHLPLRDSPALRRMNLYAHAAALVLLVVTVPPSAVRWVLLGAVAANAVLVGRRLARRVPDDVTALLLGADDRWQVDLGDGRRYGATLAARPLLGAGGVALRLRCSDGRTRALVLLADNTARDALRRLRVRLARISHRGTS